MVFPATVFFYQDPTQVPAEINNLLNCTQNSLDSNNPDIFIIDQNSGWGIETVRTLKTFFSRKPLTHTNLWAVIHDAHKLSPEAQNALLKTLEEPQANQYLLLTTNQPQNLLPTITSRCHLVKLTGNSIIPVIKKINIKNTLRENLNQSDDLALTKETALLFFQDQLAWYQQDLVANPTLATHFMIKKIIKAIAMTKANVDPKSALDYLLLS